MTRNKELGSIVLERLDSIRMTPTERTAALSAMGTAFAIVDVCARFASGLRSIGASVGHKPTVAH